MIETSSLFYLVLMSIAVILWILRDRSIRKRDLPMSSQAPILQSASGKRKSMTSKQKEKNGRNDWQPLVQTYLIEYGTVRDEFLKRVEISSQVQVYAVLLLSGTIPLVEYVNNVDVNGGDAYLLFLLTALVFCALGWYQLDLDDKVADMDNYVLGTLKPNLEKALENFISDTDDLKNILGWHYYWRADRYKSKGGLWLSLGVLGRTGVPVIGAGVLLGSYVYYEHIIQTIPWSFIRVLLVGIVAFGIIWMIIAGLLVRNKLTNITRQHQEKLNQRQNAG